MRRKLLAGLVFVFLLSVQPVFAAPPLHFTELPEIYDMFLPPLPPEPFPVWMPEPVAPPLPTPTLVSEHLPAPAPIFVPVIPTPVPTPIPTPTPTPVPDPTPTPEPIPTPANYPRGLVDISGHWAENAVIYAFDRGLIHNIHTYNTARPNYGVTRGEFAFSLNQWVLANYSRLQDLGFAYAGENLAVVGVPQNHPFRSSIDSLAAMGMIGGDVDFGPDEYVQRQEVSRIWLNLLLRLPNSSFNAAYFSGLDVENILSRYRDQSRIAGWARDSVAVMTDRGFMGGADDTFRPADTLTRAEAFSIFQSVEQGLR